MRPISFNADRSEWVVDGVPRSSGIDGQLMLFADELDDIRAVDLRHALAAAADDADPTALISLIDGEIDEENPVGPITFTVENGSLLVETVHFAEWPEDSDEEAAATRLGELINPLLADHRASARVVPADYYSSRLHLAFNVQIVPSVRGRTVGDLLRLGNWSQTSATRRPPGRPLATRQRS